MWVSAQTLRKAEKYTYSNNSELGLLAFTSGPLGQLKLVALSLATFLLVVLLVIVSAITYMSRLCELIGRTRGRSGTDDSSELPDAKKKLTMTVDNEIGASDDIMSTLGVDGDNDNHLVGGQTTLVAPNYALHELGIHTVYTETSDAVCAEYYNSLMAQYENGFKDATGADGGCPTELLSLDLYSMNACTKDPPDLIPTFYYAHGSGTTTGVDHIQDKDVS